MILIAGPTASGKTDIATALALETGAEIVTADSMQVYRYMDVGTAKPTLEERMGTIHHMLDVTDPDEPFSAAVYKDMAEACIADIQKRGKPVIVCGGTGFYINALLFDTEFAQTKPNENYISSLYADAERHGNKYVHAMLQAVDPDAAAQIHPNNIKRVIRSLAFFKDTGERISAHNAGQKIKPPREGARLCIVYRDRDTLVERIHRRVDLMIENGLEDEVRRLLAMGYNADLVSMQAIGYKEMAAYIGGRYSKDEAIQQIKINTRQFAKRQMTWFRNRSITDASDDCVKWINLDESNAMDILLHSQHFS